MAQNVGLLWKITRQRMRESYHRTQTRGSGNKLSSRSNTVKEVSVLTSWESVLKSSFCINTQQSRLNFTLAAQNKTGRVNEHEPLDSRESNYITSHHNKCQITFQCCSSKLFISR